MFMSTFAELGLAEPILRALTAEGYTTPTPIQAQAIPQVLAGRDLLACAQTGTGKTAAFALPLIERLMKSSPKARVIRVLVLAPTRELANQIQESFRTYGHHANLRSTVIYGGVGQRPQVDALRRGVDVLVATPGRLLDLIGQRHVDLRQVETLVLDEADRMLDMGFIHDVQRIVDRLPTTRQTLLFSATLPSTVRQLASSLMSHPVEVQAPREAAAEPRIDQTVYLVAKQRKRDLLIDLLLDNAMKRVIVFTKTKHMADRVQKDLVEAGLRAEAIHGNKSQAKRERTLRDFKSPKPPVLVATDIAARGIDVDLVSHVFNFDMPHEPETYVHRIGRTGRAGEAGIAVSFCCGEERALLRAIERLTRQTLAVKHDPKGPAQPAHDHSSSDHPATGEHSRPPRPGSPRPGQQRSGQQRPGQQRPGKPQAGKPAFGKSNNKSKFGKPKAGGYGAKPAQGKPAASSGGKPRRPRRDSPR